MKGYEIIELISRLPVDAKDVPQSLVTISNCGELERRIVAPPVPSPSRSRSRSNSATSSRSATPEPKEKKKKRKHRERDENGNRIHKSRKSKSARRRSPSPLPPAIDTAELLRAKEAEEATRLLVEERTKEEERARRVKREVELEEIKRRYEGQGEKGGVVYKGRGDMKAPGRNGGGMRGW